MRKVILLTSAVLLLTLNVGGSVIKESRDTLETRKDSTAIKHKMMSVSENDFFSDISKETDSYNPKAPNAAGLVQHVDCPVSYYTGTPEISIPLYEIDAAGVKIPITLSYHASGVKVAQEATWVGLGWSLSCGGLISRTVKCSDDFHEYPDSYEGYIEQGYIDAPDVSAVISDAYFKYTALESNDNKVLVKDSEPDIFFYSIPGCSGKFVIDKSHGPVLFTRNGASNVKIELVGGKTAGNHHSYTFKIVDTYGNQYYFDKKEITWAYSRSGDLNRNSVSATVFDEFKEAVEWRYEAPVKYTSSWMLTRIVTARNGEIDFSYSKELYQLPTQESAMKFNFLGGYGPGMISSAPLYSCSKTVVEGYRLTGISWDAGSAAFDSSTREDIKEWEANYKPMKLDKITVKDNSGRKIRQYELSYKYMNQYRTDKYAHVFKRLMLTDVTDVINPDIKYSMTYNEGQELPAKNSKNTDYWGYSNGVRQGEEYYCSASYDGKTYFGADKSSKLKYIRSGILNTVTYPTGEKTTFEYETLTSTSSPTPVMKDISASLGVFNRYESDAYEDEDFPKETCTTITIAEYTLFDIYAHTETVTGKTDNEYLYNNESYPIFRVYRMKSDGTKNDDYFYSITAPSELKTEWSYDTESYKLGLPAGTYSFEAYAPIKDVYVAVHYKYKATVLEPGETVELGGLRIKAIRGTDTRTFSYSSSCMIVKPVTSYLYTLSGTTYDEEVYLHNYFVQCSESVIPMSTLKDGYIYGYGEVTENKDENTSTTYKFHNETEEQYSEYPFVPTILDCQNGLLINETVRTGLKIKQTSDYQYASSSQHIVCGFIFKSYERVHHPYNYIISWPQLKSKTVVRHEDNGTFTETVNYKYNKYFYLSEEKFSSDGKNYLKRYIYPPDKEGSVYGEMSDRHMIGIPIETKLMQENYVIKARKTEYGKFGGMLLPESVSITENTALMTDADTDNLYKKKTIYEEYSDRGNPRVMNTDECTTVILWGYSGTHPVAVIKNGTYQQVSSLLGSQKINEIENAAQLSESDMAAINSLRGKMPLADVTTMTYIPLTGVSSITDARGFRTYYDYDASGRLTEEYFKENGFKRTLKRYTYHYHEK